MQTQIQRIIVSVNKKFRLFGGIMVRAISFVGLVSPLFLLANAYAQELEEVRVWGTAVRASSLELDENAVMIRQADHVSDLLRTLPGVDVGGAHSLNQRITIRSMDDKDLRITIDGANQNTYMYHHMGNLQIHADILSAVDVEVGTNSVVNGGLGGAVRFQTKSARDLLAADSQFGARVQAAAGTNSSQNFSLTGFGQLTESLDLLAYYNDVSRKNYTVGGGEILDQEGDEIEGSDGSVKGLEGDLYDALIKLGWQLTDNQRFKLGYEAYSDKGDYSYRPDMGLATDLAISENLQVPLLWPTEFSRDTLTLNYELDWGGHSTLHASVFHNDSTLFRDERGWAENPDYVSWAGEVEGNAGNTGFNIIADSALGAHTLTYGAEIIHYDTEYKAQYAESKEESSESASNTAVYLQDRIALGEQFTLIPGLRYDSYQLDSIVVEDTFSAASGALAAEWQLVDSLLVKLSTTQLFKGPEIGEVFTGAGLYDTPNSGIDAETGANNEFSVAFQKEALGAELFSAGFTLFQTDITDYIYDYAPAPEDSGARYWKDNVGDMTIEGIEAYVGYQLHGLSALLTYSTAGSELSAAQSYADLDGARLDRQQGDTISFNLDYEIEAIDVVLHWDFLVVADVDAGLDLDGATLDNAKDGYTVHNLSARWMPYPVSGLSFIFGVDNLFDEFYASQSSRTGVSFHPRFGQLYLQDYEPGRNVKATVAYQF